MILRIFGIILLVLALTVLGRDLWRGEPISSWTTVGECWYDLSPFTLTMTQTVLQRYLWPPLWDDGLLPLLFLPVSVFFGGIGLILFGLGYLFRHRAVSK